MQGPGVATFPIDGLTPYIVPADQFYRIDTALTVPQVNVDTWSMKVSGMVDNPFELSFADLLAMPQVQEAVTLSCVSNEVGGDLVGNALWQGVPLRALLDRAGVQSGATQIVGRSVDGFTAGFPTAALDDGRTALVAVGMNGAPAAGPARLPRPPGHRRPLRLRLGHQVAQRDPPHHPRGLRRRTGFPEVGPRRARSRPSPRIDVPKSGANVSAGPIAIAGVAWAPGPERGITKVEVQVDDGDWMEAQLGEVISNETWREWMVQWDAVPGNHQVQVRATDGTGETQTSDKARVDPDGATGWHTRRFKVSG